MRKKEVFRTMKLAGNYRLIEGFSDRGRDTEELLDDVRTRILARRIMEIVAREEFLLDRESMLTNERRREDHHRNLQQFYLYSGQVVFLPHARSVWVPR